jgi:hypothetical protein
MRQVQHYSSACFQPGCCEISLPIGNFSEYFENTLLDNSYEISPQPGGIKIFRKPKVEEHFLSFFQSAVLRFFHQLNLPKWKIRRKYKEIQKINFPTDFPQVYCSM